MSFFPPSLRLRKIDKVRGLNWYDRNPESKVDYGAWTEPPHSTTQRISYTCPAGKIAMVEVLSCLVMRITAATTSDFLSNNWTFTPNGGSERAFLTARIINNTIGASDTKAIGTTLIMLAGDKITAYTTDMSVGGTCNYFMAYKVTEFDV